MPGQAILFICTGNIFRSMTAERALKAALGPGADYNIGSAGLKNPPHGVLPFVAEYLTGKGIDISGHRSTKLTATILAQATLVVAMSTDHQAGVLQDFDRAIPLFSEIAYNTTEPLRDVNEVVPNWRVEHDKAVTYGCSVMDYIFNGMPGFISRIPTFMDASQDC